MRAHLLLAAGIMLLLNSCEQPSSPANTLGTYYPLDSLLNAQIASLAKQKSVLQKEVQMDEELEVQTLTPDSAGWAAEMVILRDFNLNKSFYVGAFETIKSSDRLRHDLKEGQSAPVQFFEAIFENGELSQIKGNYFEDKTIYQHRRELQMDFVKGRLVAYEVSGFQRMMTRDTVRYRISGRVD